MCLESSRKTPKSYALPALTQAQIPGTPRYEAPLLPRNAKARGEVLLAG